MKYLILHNNEAFYTNYFDPYNHFVQGMVVFDLIANKYTLTGFKWEDIQDDSL